MNIPLSCMEREEGRAFFYRFDRSWENININKHLLLYYYEICSIFPTRMNEKELRSVLKTWGGG